VSLSSIWSDMSRDQTVAETLDQLIIVTGVGVALTSWLGWLREKTNRREARRTAIRNILREVDGLYRSVKHVKRMLRSREKKSGDGRIIVGESFFEKHMEELSRVQLALEQSKQIIRTRSSLFGVDRQRRILDELSYAEKYVDAIVSEFERQQVIRRDDSYFISDQCVYLNDYLDTRRYPPEVEVALKNLEADEGKTRSTIAEYKLFLKIERSLGDRKAKTKSVAYQCMRLSLHEMRDALSNM
jgi:hypothetical protein